MTSTVTILGSTGSIGLSSLRVIDALGGDFNVRGLSCHSNLDLLEKQIIKYKPALIAVCSPEALYSEQFKKLEKKFPDTEFLHGEDGVIELARRGADIMISAIVGSAGLKPSLAAIPHVKRIALANKETLVMAGDIFMKEVEKHAVELIPVDSEHSAIFSLISNISKSDIRRIILTASGGSLMNRPADELHSVTPEEALAHPTWDMGSKITIDSATLMNKGFEVIESHHLFDIEYNSINIIIHPESIIHSMVETIDGAVYAHLGIPDMAFPIMNALSYPERRKNPFERLDLLKIGSLNFIPCEDGKFPSLALCYNSGRMGGTMPAVLNAANEVAVKAFLEKKIIFTDIIKIVEKILEIHSVITDPDLSAILEADKWARETAKSKIRG